ncbi:hypothetical protein D0Z00_001737 [Geotrichum galactomycetum]|uniref:Uncharacterized protein n=1 Tax=Geotrichum galactomycetum TaxID=27317 RepID=A0ACB6V634_9ASCO|nr:hypothetical protein D0Z00_001737 [Geotrichum candidum]
MKLSIVALAGVASAAGFNSTTVTVPHTITTTTVVDEYVTYCPEPTIIVESNKTITITKPGTVTITDCPCTRTVTKTTVTVLTKPIETKSYQSINSRPVASIPVESKSTETPIATAVHPTANITTSKPPVSQGGAVTYGASGVLAGVIAAVAYFL